MGGHLGRGKTEAQLKRRVFWPGIHKLLDTAKNAPSVRGLSYKPAWVPLVLMPQEESSFERIALDIVGPFPNSAAGYQYVLVMIDYPT